MSKWERKGKLGAGALSAASSTTERRGVVLLELGIEKNVNIYKDGILRI
jgi:hypothetical protein